MKNSRDASVWRSLAVAFGDGLAFGAGVKLTQAAVRRAAAPAPLRQSPALEGGLILGRVDALEDRISRMEATPAQDPAPPFDPAVLDAIVTAVETKLKEHASEVENRFSELETRMAAELETLRAKDGLAAVEGEMRAESLRAEFAGEIATLREDDEVRRAAIQEEIASVRRQSSVETAAVVELHVARRVAQAVSAEIVVFRRELEARDREIAALRQRLEQSDRNVFETIVNIGKACENAALRGSVTSTPQQQAAPETQPAPAPAARTVIEMPEETPVPKFTQPETAARLFRVPVVSALTLACAAGAALLHYLSNAAVLR